MKSKASIKSHPLHPMLIAFPITFLTSAAALDVLAYLFNLEESWRAASYLSLAGVISGVIAGIPGIIDYIFIVPPKSSAAKRATFHMAVNLTVIALFLYAYLNKTEAFSSQVVVIETISAALLGVGGWLGGTLVFRNQIGVDHRYAEAGKWKELYIDENEHREWFPIADESELTKNQMKLIHVHGKRIVLANSEEGYLAFEDRCTHRGGPLSDGTMSNCIVTCPWHGSQFDTRNGKVHSGPAEKGIRTYSVRVRDGKVWLSLTSDSPRASYKSSDGAALHENVNGSREKRFDIH